MMGHRIAAALAFVAAMVGSGVSAQRAPIGPATRSYVRVDTAVVALTNVRVIDGTGAAPRDGQTVVIRDGRIASIGPAASASIPAGAVTMDLAGKTVIP